jgi:tRNA(fMet)-specific endonuclease VapC
MNGRFLLDANIVIGIFTEDRAIQQQLAQRPQVFLSAIVLGELCFGAQKSTRLGENLRRIDDLLTEAVPLACDTDTAYEYGILRIELRLKGRPIPENDIWLAAQARQHKLTLVSRDRHFAEVDNLRWEQW